MTQAEFHPFIQTFNRLAVCLPIRRDELQDDRVLEVKYEEYFDTLRDLPLAAVQQAVVEIQRRGSGFFPSTQEWYRVADDLAYRALLDEQQRALPASTDTSAFAKAKAARARFLAELRAQGTPANGVDWGRVADAFERAIPCRDPDRNPYASWCADCDDTGWLSHVCRDGDRCDQHADVDAAWGEHERVSRCGCRAMNPKIQQRIKLARRT